MHITRYHSMSSSHSQEVAFCVRQSKDVDEHAAHISAWEQEYDQISGGGFQGRVSELWLPAERMQLFHEYTLPATSQYCASWPGSVWMGFADRRSYQPWHFCGQEQAGSSGAAQVLMCASASAGFALCTPPHFGIYGVVIDLQWLRTHMAWLGLGRSGFLLDHAPKIALLPPERHAALCRMMEQLLALGRGMPSQGAWRTAAIQALLPQLLFLLCGSGPLQTAPQAAQRRLGLVMAARDMASHAHYQTLGVEELCQQLHVTRRTLQNHFQSTLGQSPANFLKAVRLNACRRALRDAQGRQTVQDIAARWGFYHMGHFSQDYKRLFGTSPSQTLQQ